MKKNLNSVLLCFLTVLSAGTLSNAQTLDYTFVTVGCNRIDPIDIVSAGVGSTYDTVSTANIGALNRIFTEVSALSPQPKFLFLTGDIVMGYRADTVYLDNQLKGWKALYYAHPISKSGIKVVVIPGNHETQDKAAGKKSTAALERTFVREMKDFIIGNNGPVATGKVAGTDSLMTDQSQLTYSFNYKGDHFVIFNTDPTGRDSRIPFRWLKNDLQNNKARHTFSFGHKPAYSSKFKPLDGLEAFVAQRDSFWTVLENAHAEAMFAAHEHIWDTIQGHKGKTWQVIAGNGGSAVETTLNPVVNKKWNEAPYNYHGFTLVSVYKNNKVVCQSMGHDIGAHYFDEVPANPTTERANFRLETGVVIDHTPLANTHQNGPFAVTATITDNISVVADTLWFWVNGVVSKTVASVSGTTYTYTIPAQTGSGIIEYSFKAVDNFGQVSWLPSEPNAKFKFSFGPVAVSKFVLNKSAKLGTYLGQDIFLSGFSGLSAVKGKNDEFYTITDRGPNLDANNNKAVASDPNKANAKLFALPNFHPTIIHFKTVGDSIQILDTMSVKRPDGTATTGLINPIGGGGTGELALIDTLGTQGTPDVWGIDSEGIIEGNKSDFWICEEYGTSVWNVEKRTGKVIHRYAPFATLQSQDIAIDSVFRYRNSNKGLEGVAFTPGGKAYAFIQNTLLFKAADKKKTQMHRFVEIDPATNKTRMFAYAHDKVPSSGALSSISNDKRYIGDAVAVNDDEFLILEHGKSATESYAKIYKISLTGATVINQELYNGKALEEYVDSTAAANAGITVVKKTLFLDLVAAGYDPTIEKQEGLALVNDTTIAIANDNDFGVISLNADGKVSPNGVKTVVYKFSVPQSQKLNLVAPANEGPSTTQSPYVQGTQPGVETKALLSVGDAINGYRMAGIPDGLGAYDNGNGTFTLLMNHEISGTPANPEGVVRAHGGKGAFVSKWTINKSDLSVVKGEDLIKNVNLWNGTGYTAYGPSDTTKMKSFLRFCSADLPAVSAYYNGVTGKGTTERIFMNGEESSAERGRAMAHIATGPNAGTSYELPRLGKAAWENALANPATGDKTLVGINNDGSTTDSKVYFYLGTKTTTGTEVEKAGLTNGKLLSVKIAGFPAERTSATVSNGVPTPGTRFSLLDLGNVENMTGAALNTAANTAGATKFSRVEDGAWDPSNPNDYYFNTTDQLDQVNDGIGTQVGRSKVWRLRFDDITNPELGGVAEAVLDGTEGHTMLDNMAIDKYGHILLLEDVGNAAHNGKVWQYTIATDDFKQIAKHDPSRFGDIGKPATAPFNQDEETSGIIDVQDILGAGKFLVVDQAHYLTDAETVEGGQLLQLFNPDTYNAQGSVTPQTAYVVPVENGVTLTPIISSGEKVGTYRMAGIPDGLGAYDNGNGTFTLLMNHEISGTAANPEGIVRAHGGKGAFVSKWTINKSDLSVLKGEDLIKNVNLWNGTGYTLYTPTDTTKMKSFLRFCSADLPAVSAYYNSASGKGTTERIFMNGEESNAERGRAMAHIATGPNAGTSYELPRLGKAAWENALANPATGDKTFVGINNDGSTTDSKVHFYLGTKTTTGTEIEKAGLTNGKLLTVQIAGYPAERTSATVSNGVPAVGTRFSLLDLGNVENMTGAALNTAANTAGATKFSRVEDGAWDPKHPNDYYFNTTDQLDQVNDGIGTQVGRSKVWRLRFDDITNPELGGVAEAVIEGTEGHTMLDNMAIDNYGHILLLEDVGNAAHNGKVWQYTIATDEFKIIAKHDPARFGDIGVPATAPFNQDEETSGIIDVQDILGAGKFLVVDQAHYLTDAETVEGGQLLALFNPDTYKAAQVITGFDGTSDVSTTSAITLYPNPTNNEATLSMMLEKGGKYVISVRDMKGNEALASVEKEFAKGQNNVTLNTSSLSNGIYFVQISNGSTTTRIKTVVLH